MYKALLFDLDGTLTDSSEGITKSIAYALKEMNVACEDLNELKKYIGPPLSVSFRDYFEGEDITKAVKLYRLRYNEIGWKENRVYDGVIEMLASLKASGIRLIMATSKPEVFAIKIAEYFKFAEYFELLGGATTDGTRNDKHEVINYVLENTGLSNPEEILMIGDRYHDVEGAAKFGIKTLGVTYGFGTDKELLAAGAIDVVDSPEEVVNYVMRSIS